MPEIVSTFNADELKRCEAEFGEIEKSQEQHDTNARANQWRVTWGKRLIEAAKTLHDAANPNTPLE